MYLFLVFVAGCKRGSDPTAESPRDSRGPGADAPGARAPDAMVRTPDPDLPPPSEALGAVPDDLAGKVGLEVVATGLDRPVLVTFAPGDSRQRLFVVEQHVARIRTIEGGKLSKKAFLSLKGKVSTDNEQGLLGLAFHPRFAENGRLFVYYTDDGDDIRVEEYTVDASDPDKVDPSTRKEIFFQKHPYSNHNGGHLEFGPDGKLYLGLGDGGGGGDPLEAGQDRDTKLAKLLRIDVDAKKPKAEIVAIGLRNPWRFDFDSKTGDLYIGDVGQDAWESVYVVGAGEIDGKNFGWSVSEGRHCFEKRRCDMSKFTPPVADYPRDEGCSVTGGVVYRGAAIPELDGVYFYADYCIGWIRSFRWEPDGIRQHWEWRPVLDPESQLSQISSFGLDHAGEVHVISLDGTIWKLVPRA
jgi:glucose/arabinose dehydrogenase